MPLPTALVVKNGSKALAMTARGHAGSGVGHREEHVLAGRDPFVARGVAIVEMRVLGLDGQMSAVRHGVAGVDHEVDDHVLELVGVDADAPQTPGQHRLEPQVGADGVAQKVRHSGDQRVEVGGLGLQRLLAGEGKQPLGQQSRPPGAVAGRVDVAPSPFVPAETTAEQVEGADHHGKHIVEIVGDASGELTDRLHLLSLAQGFLREFELRFGFLLRGDVAARRIDQAVLRGRDPRDPAGGAVGVQHPGFDRGHRSAEGDLRGLVVIGAVVWVGKAEVVAADDFGGIASQNLRPSRIGRPHRSVGVDHDEQILGCLPKAIALGGLLGDAFCEIGVQHGERLGGGLLVLDVGVGPDPTRDIAVGASDRHRPRKVPTPNSIGPTQAELGLVVPSGRQGRDPVAAREGDLVGVDHGDPALAIQRPARHPAVVVDAVIEPIEQAARRGGPDVIRHGLRQGAELSLALGQRFLGGAALADVDEGADGAFVEAVAEDRTHPIFHRDRLAAQRKEDLVIHVARFAGRGGDVDRAPFHRVGRAVRVAMVDDVVKLPPHHVLLARESQHAQEGLVAKLGHAVAVEGVKRFAGGIEEVLQVGSAVAQRLFGGDPRRGLHGGDQDSANTRRRNGVRRGAVAQGEPGVFPGVAAAVDAQENVLGEHRGTGAVEDRLVTGLQLRPDLGPRLPRGPAQGPGMLVAEDRAIRIVIDQDEVRPPAQGHRKG